MTSIVKKLTTLTWLIRFLILIIASAPFFYMWWPDNMAFFAPHSLLHQYGGPSALAVWQQILGFFVIALPASLLCLALQQLLCLIHMLKKGRWFDEVSEMLCRKFSSAMIWFVVAQVLHRTLLVLVITATYPPGEKQLAFALSSDDLFAIIPAIFALIFAHIVNMARSQQSELNQIV